MKTLDRAGSARRRLLAAATPALYLHNPFRVLGLATTASAREVRRRRQVLTIRPGTGDSRLPLAEPPTPDQVRQAVETLGDPEARLVAELFWWWDEPGECGCPARAHQLHDLAVHAHASALDAEHTRSLRGVQRSARWTKAAEAWGTALAHNDFWAHLAHRAVALRDRRLDESTVEGLRKTLPEALIIPQATLGALRRAPVLLALLDTWELAPSVVADTRLRASAPLVRRVTDLLADVQAALEGGDGERARWLAFGELVPEVDLLELALPHQRFRKAAWLREQAAVVLNNTGLRLARAELLRVARRLAVDAETREAVTHNLREVTEQERLAEPLRRVAALLEQGEREQVRRLQVRPPPPPLEIFGLPWWVYLLALLAFLAATALTAGGLSLWW